MAARVDIWRLIRVEEYHILLVNMRDISQYYRSAFLRAVDDKVSVATLNRQTNTHHAAENVKATMVRPI